MPADHMIRCRHFACVADGMRLIGRLENDRTRAYFLLFSVYERFDGAVFNNNHLFFRMFVGRMRCFTGIQCRNVAFQFIRCGGLRTKKRPHRSDRGASDGDVVSVENR
jgi:hypothetical protein